MDAGAASGESTHSVASIVEKPEATTESSEPMLPLRRPPPYNEQGNGLFERQNTNLDAQRLSQTIQLFDPLMQESSSTGIFFN